jgi:Holliday junction resolvasome RuvABC endonuclease subunit
MASMTLTLSAADASPPPQASLAAASGDAAILALDLGTTTGWALRNLRGRILSGTAEFRPLRFEGGGMRYLRFERWLDETLRLSGDVEAIYFEEVRRHVGVDAAHAYGGFLAGLTAWCEEHAIAYQGVPVGTIKRFIAGKGNADKAAVIAAIRERGFSPADDNEADAIAILLWAIETRGGTR